MPSELKTPHVLLGIATRNRADILPKAISSALAQSYRSLEVAVIDDGSTDETPALAERFTRVCWTRWESNRGYMAARNEWMRNAKAAYFAGLDDDAWFVAGDELELAVGYLESHPDVAAIAFDVLSPDRPEVNARSEPVHTAMFIGCGHILRLSAIHEVGAYASFPGSYGSEEKDLCLRLLDAGYRAIKLPGVHVWHDKTTVERDLPAQHRSGVCNDLTMALRRTSLFAVPFVLGLKLVRHLRFAITARLLPTCFQGIQLFLRSAPASWRSREPVRFSTLRQFSRLSHS